MSDEQMKKINGRTYDQFRTDECYDLDQFDYEFDYSCLEIESFTFNNGEIENLVVSGAAVEDQFQYVIIDTQELKRLFIRESEPTVSKKLVKQAVMNIVRPLLILQSGEDSGAPDIYTRDYLSDQIADEVYKLSNEEN